MFGIKTRIGLRAKFITGITILVVLIDIAFSLFFIRRQREFIHLNLKERGLALAANLAYNSEYGVLTANSNILNNLIAGVIKQPDVEYCIVRNIEGEILAAQGLKGELETAINKLKSIETDEPTVKLWDGEADQKYYIIRAPVASRIIDSFRYETGLFLEEEDWIEESKKEKEPAELAGEEVLFEGEKPGSEEKIGAVIIGISLTNAARLIRETGRTAFLIAIFILLISFVITIFLSKILIDPIKKLSAGTDRIAGGDLDFKVRIESGDEIGQLADSFNKMIVDLKRYQDELIEAKEYAGNIIESMIDTLIIVDPEGKIASMNKATTDLLGYEEEEILGRPISELFTEEDRKVLDLKGGENENPGDRSNIFRNVEKTYLAKDGRRIPVLFSSSQIRDKKSMLTGIVCVTRDITKRKEAEELAEERRVAMEDRIRKSERSRKAMLYMVEDLNRTSRELKTTQSQLVRSERLAAIGELAGGVAHELRNSLGVLTNAAAYLKLALPDADETVRKNLNHMKENVARANKVITDLLDFTRESK
ncbi:MAG: PAS domain S-box protein, partial [Candidatus Auribacterota bacterium]|nr:PAS domain S-box protein [Candidatus Auribacterota bacterium]